MPEPLRLPRSLRLLVAEGEPPETRERRRESVGRSSGETYVDLLAQLAPEARIDRVTPTDGERRTPDLGSVADYHAVFLTGSPLHLWKETPEGRRQVEFMRAVFDAGVPAFGSCAGLQVATVAAGGSVRPMRVMETGFARRITPTQAGAAHPMLQGRPPAYDAPAIHTDEVGALPDGATLLAGNTSCAVQAAQIRSGAGVFWGAQYHPEISLAEVAAALRRQSDSLIKAGFARSPEELESDVALIDELHMEPQRRDLCWRLGLDRQVTDPDLRTLELKNFLTSVVAPARLCRRPRQDSAADLTRSRPCA